MALLTQTEIFRHQVMQRLRGRLAPGAEDVMKNWRWWDAPGGAFVAGALGFLEKNPRFWARDYTPPDSPLELVASVLPFSDEGRERFLTDRQRWSDTPLETVADLAVKHLDANPDLRAVAPPPSAAEGRVAGVLLGHFSDLPIAARASMAKAWAFEFGSIHDEHALVERIARRLSLPAAAAHHGVEPLAKDDRRLNAKVQAQLDARAELLGGVEGNRRHGPLSPEPSQARDERGQFTGETSLYSGPNPF